MKASRNMFIAFSLNLVFAIIEVFAGLAFQSSAILADAVHDFGDAIAIGFSTLLELVSNKKENHRFTFGYKRLSLLGAFVTSIILITGSCYVLFKNVPRLWQAPPVHYDGMLALGFLAIIINYVAGRIVSKGKTRNEAILSLNFLEDILGWLAIILVSIIMKFTHWYFLDPLFSLIISSYILSQALPKFRGTLTLLLEGVPESCDYQDLLRSLQALDQVDQVLQFNLWSLDGLDNLATLHITLSEQTEPAEAKSAILEVLKQASISSATIQNDSNLEEHSEHAPLHVVTDRPHHH